MATPVEAAYAESNKMLRKESAKLLELVPGGAIMPRLDADGRHLGCNLSMNSEQTNTDEIESELNKKKENQMTHIEKHINLLGMRVEDRVTGFTGVVTSVGFDLYGCIQAVVNPGVDKEGKLQDQTWFDVSRLALIGDNPVIDRPNYESGRQAEGKQGAADKPRMMKP